MHNKNEDIHLWMLEQDRKNSRARLLEAAGPHSETNLPDITYCQRFNDDGTYKDENKPQTFAETTNLEQLTKEKECLEEEFQCLEEEQRNLDLRARILCEKIIQAMRKRNSVKQLAVNQLRERIAKMETQLGIEDSIQETKKKNIEKQQEIGRLQETIGGLGTQFGGLALSRNPKNRDVISYCS
jgi:hypothetical protein